MLYLSIDDYIAYMSISLKKSVKNTIYQVSYKPTEVTFWKLNYQMSHNSHSCGCRPRAFSQSLSKLHIFVFGACTYSRH